MAKHEFGIMQMPPEKGKRYDNFEPDKYNCISVDDDYLEGIIGAFNGIEFYHHTLSVKEKGLAYCGITLIPPESIDAFIEVIKNIYGLKELLALSQKALEENKWIIHFGL